MDSNDMFSLIECFPLYFQTAPVNRHSLSRLLRLRIHKPSQSYIPVKI